MFSTKVSGVVAHSFPAFSSQFLYIACNTYTSLASTFRHVCPLSSDVDRNLKLPFIPGVFHCSLILQASLQRPYHGWNGSYSLEQPYSISEVRSCMIVSKTAITLFTPALLLEQTTCWTSLRFMLSIAAHSTCEPDRRWASRFFSNNCVVCRVFAISCVALVYPFSLPVSFCQRLFDFLNKARQVSKCFFSNSVVLHHDSTLFLRIHVYVCFTVHYIFWNPDFLSQPELTR